MMLMIGMWRMGIWMKQETVNSHPKSDSLYQYVLIQVGMLTAHLYRL